MVNRVLPCLTCFLLLVIYEAFASPEQPAAVPAGYSWPGETWEESTPAKEGLDGRAISQLDEEFREGKHGYVDSMLIIRNGRIVFEANYVRDYAAINAGRMTGESGPYNYFDVAWHPYYQGTDLHTMAVEHQEFYVRADRYRHYSWRAPGVMRHWVSFCRIARLRIRRRPRSPWTAS